MFYFVFNKITAFFFINMYYSISQYIFCEGNLYLKNNPNYHETCCNFASRSYSVHQAVSLKWCLSGNPATLKVTDPQGGTGAIQEIIVKHKG